MSSLFVNQTLYINDSSQLQTVLLSQGYFESCKATSEKMLTTAILFHLIRYVLGIEKTDLGVKGTTIGPEYIRREGKRESNKHIEYVHSVLVLIQYFLALLLLRG